jgi:hypothetical protein
MRPSPDAPVMAMDEFRNRFIAAFSEGRPDGLAVSGQG